MQDWDAWHRAYDDPDSVLTRRLGVVRHRFRDALDVIGAACPSILSLCAGEGRDVLPVLAEASTPARGLLVEQDPTLARRAAAAAAAAGLEAVEVRCADAGDPETFADFLPADIVMLCGIFGNIVESDIQDVIGCVPQLVAGGGVVIWTRGGWEPDLRPKVRRWFEDVGLPELSFDGDPEPFGVGVNQRPASLAVPPALPPRLFTFTR